MSSIKALYGAQNQALTITLASLASGSARESTVVDNTSNKFLDALVQLKIKAGGSGTAATGYVNVYAYGTVDGGTTYGEGATGADAGITLVSPTNLRLIGRLNVVANAVTYKGNPMSVAAAFGGVLPDKWGIVVENQSGGTLDTTGSNHAAVYQGVNAQVV